MNFSKENIKAAFVRAIRTMAQVSLSYITIGLTIKEVDWANLLSLAVVAAIYSLLTSIVTGLPESKMENLDENMD